MNYKIDYGKSIIPIVKKAGNTINHNFRFKRKVFEKGRSNYLTDLDKTIENYIIESITEISPNEVIISEEDNHFVHNDSFWVLDPIDGTTNLIHNYTSICISLSHIVDNKIQFGVVYNPISHEMFYAERSKGAFLDKNGRKHAIAVSDVNSIKHSLIGFGCPYDKTKIEFLFKILKSLIYECDDLKRVGPASLDLCYVACGRLDAYIELDLENWDYLAGALILSEAGGTVSDFHGNKNLISKSNIIASNSILHSKLLTIIKNT